MSSRYVPGLVTEEDGASAVEFAALAPLLLILCLAVLDGWSLVSAGLDVRSAVNAAATMAMGGEHGTGELQSLVLANWQNKPSDASVGVTSNCFCQQTPVDCASACSNGLPSTITLTISAAGTWQAPFSAKYLPSSVRVSDVEDVRVR